MKHGAILFLVMVFLLAVSCTSGDENLTEAQQIEKEASRMENEAAEAEVTAAELTIAFAGDEAKADERYKNRVILVKGIVDNVGVDVEEKPYVMLGGDAGRVQVMFARKYHKQALNLLPGQNLEIKGRCGGQFANVILHTAVIPPTAP
ncbi:MAG: hypothetical protein P9L99_05865 [Candidatus Lernaella stagnicola]|nr:hypothetical protein [Candidatus Lernaella stagnicola]